MLLRKQVDTMARGVCDCILRDQHIRLTESNVSKWPSSASDKSAGGRSVTCNECKRAHFARLTASTVVRQAKGFRWSSDKPSGLLSLSQSLLVAQTRTWRWRSSGRPA